MIRSVQAPIQKPQNLHWPPLETIKTPERSVRPPPVPLRPPQLDKHPPDVHEISVSPLRLSQRNTERPRSAVQDRMYKDILFDNTERTSSPVRKTSIFNEKMHFSDQIRPSKNAAAFDRRSCFYSSGADSTPQSKATSQKSKRARTIGGNSYKRAKNGKEEGHFEKCEHNKLLESCGSAVPPAQISGLIL